MEEQVGTGAVRITAGEGGATDRSVHFTAGEGGAIDMSVHVTAGVGGQGTMHTPPGEDGSAARRELQYQQALAKLTPGTMQFKALVKSRRKGKQYLQPLMFWASRRERSRG